MDGLLKKLGYKGQNPVLVLNSPEEYEETIKGFEGLVHRSINGKYDFMQIFAESMEKASELVSQAMGALNADGVIWLCYPKGSSKKYKTNINRDKSWEIFKPFEYEPVSLVAVNEDWSAIRFRHIDSIKKITRKTASTEKGKARIGEQ